MNGLARKPSSVIRRTLGLKPDGSEILRLSCQALNRSLTISCVPGWMGVGPSDTWVRIRFDLCVSIEVMRGSLSISFAKYLASQSSH